jgi:hypothetical protein
LTPPVYQLSKHVLVTGVSVWDSAAGGGPLEHKRCVTDINSIRERWEPCVFPGLGGTVRSTASAGSSPGAIPGQLQLHVNGASQERVQVQV